MSERRLIHLADVKQFYCLTQTAFNMLRLS